MTPQAVILVGGLGTRLAEEFPDIPKGLVPVNGRPFLEWQLEWLRRGGITRILLAAGHKAEVFERYLMHRPSDGMVIVLSREPGPLGTGGALRYAHAQDLLANDPVLILNGDTLIPNFDLSTVFHGVEKRFPPCGKIFVAPIENAGRYGTVEFGADGIVAAFREKAKRDAGFVNAGIYLLPLDLIASIPPGQAVSIEKEIFPELVRQRRLVAVPVSPPLLDMGTLDGLAKMEAFLQA